MAVKWLLMTFCYTYRSVSCSAIIREASSCSRWEQIQRSTTGLCSESERPWNTQSKWIVSIKFFPSVFMELWKSRGKDCKSQWGWKTPRRQSLLDTTGLMHIWTHRVCERIPSMHKSKSDGLSALRRDKDPNPHPSPEAVSNWQLFKKENFVFSNGVLLGIQITLKGRPHA